MEIIKKHEFVCGRTQSGKTFYSIEKAKAWDGPVLFWNPQDVKTGLPVVNGRYEINHIIEYLKAGHKMDYRPQIDGPTALKELELLTSAILGAHVRSTLDNTLFVVDECQIFARSSGRNPIEDIATRGLGKGLYGMFITQRPALTSNTLFTQAEVKTYFAIEEEEYKYFKGQGVDIEAIQGPIKEAGPYNYMQKYMGELKGPKKL